MAKKLSEMSLEELWKLFPIILSPPNKKYAAQFERERVNVEEALSALHGVKVNHIGSTAVDGIFAKPTVDILVEVGETELSAARSALLGCGYTQMSECGSRHSFNKGYTESGFADEVFHLHLRLYGDNDEMYFRDFLRENPAIAKKYEELKLSLLTSFEHDRDGYTAAKSDFVTEYTEAAKQLYGDRYAKELHKKYSLVIFDMDGTVLDTLGDLSDALNFALKKSSFPARGIDEVRSFIGNGVKHLVARGVPPQTTEADKETVYSDFGEYYARHRADKTMPYEGIMQLLNDLKSSGMKLAVASNKADAAVGELCERFFPSIFDAHVGQKEGIRRKPFPDTVNEALRLVGATVSDAVYVGDTEVDMETAKNAGMGCISVSWGYRDKDYLQKIGARLIADTPDEIKNFLF